MSYRDEGGAGGRQPYGYACRQPLFFFTRSIYFRTMPAATQRYFIFVFLAHAHAFPACPSFCLRCHGCCFCCRRQLHEALLIFSWGRKVMPLQLAAIYTECYTKYCLKNLKTKCTMSQKCQRKMKNAFLMQCVHVLQKCLLVFHVICPPPSNQLSSS